MRNFVIPHCIQLKNTINYQMTDKKLELLLKTKNGRVIPAYLNPRMSFYSHLSPEFIKTTDSNFIIHEKLQNKYEKNLSNLLADILRDAINCIISTERFCKENYPHLLRSIFTNPYILDVGNFSEKLKILKDDGLALHLTKHSIERLYIQIFQSIRDIYKEFGEIIIDSPSLYNKPKNNYIESEEEILYQTILNEETINNSFFRDNILTKILILQAPVINLQLMMNPGDHDPLYQSMKLKRAKSGGIKANADKIKIINYLINYIKTKKPESFLNKKELETFNQEKKNHKLDYKFQSFPNFCTAHTKELMKIIDDYKYKNPYTKLGKTLDSTNFPRYFRSWIKDSEELKAEMIFHVYSAEEKKLLNTYKKANKDQKNNPH